MVFICCAFYAEAKPVIDFYGLKKNHYASKFDIYEGENIILIITGMGTVITSAAVSHLLTRYSAQKTDIALNIGIAGAVNPDYRKGEAVLCNKVVNIFSERCFYPDILVKHPFKEGTLLTYPRPVRGKEKVFYKGDLVDMEGAGFFEAASSFLYVHNIQLIKVVYDFLDDLSINKEEIYGIIRDNLQDIDYYIKALVEANEIIKNPLSYEDEEILKKIAQNLKLTFTMERRLYNLALAYKIVKKDKDLGFLKEFLNIKPDSKREVKYYFELIKKRLSV